MPATTWHGTVARHKRAISHGARFAIGLSFWQGAGRSGPTLAMGILAFALDTDNP
jgi:hypothetical protein